MNYLLDLDELKAIKKLYSDKDVSVVAVVDEVIRLRERSIAYLCTVCGGFAYTEFESIDCGTTLTCDKCKGKTVIMLFEVKKFVEWSRLFDELKEK